MQRFENMEVLKKYTVLTRNNAIACTDITSCRGFSGPIIKSGAVKIALHSSAKCNGLAAGLFFITGVRQV